MARVANNLFANKTDPTETVRAREKARIQFGLLPGREQQRVLEQVAAPTFGRTLTLQEQHELLTILVGAQCHNLDFRPFKTILTNEQLLPILRHAGKQILKLNLSGCTQLTSDILKDIERYCPHLKRLRVNDQPSWSNVYIGNFPELTTLECNQAIALTDIRFGQLPKLKKLSLAGAVRLEVLGDQGLRITVSTQAWQLPQLQQLDTRNCPLLRLVHIQADQPQALDWQWQGCTALKLPSIYFSWMQELPARLAGKLATKLKADPLTTDLNLSYSGIGDADAQALAELLKANTNLTSLNLSHNQLSTAGAQVLAKILKANTNLTSLDLRENELYAAGAQALAEALRTNTTLIKLYISDYQKYPPVRMIGGRYEERSDPLSMIGHFDNHLGEAGMRSVGIISAYLARNHLQKNPALTELNLRFSWLGLAGAQILAKALEKNNTLTALDLFWNDLGDDGVQVLATVLKKNGNLTALGLGHNNLGEAGAQTLADLLKINTTLTTLHLSQNNLGSTGVQILAKALEKNNTLTALNLLLNGLGSAGVQALTELLKTSTALAELNLSWNGLGDADAWALAEVLKTNTTLNTLDIGENKLGEAGAQALVEMLKTNTTLITLHLWDIQRSETRKEAEHEIHRYLDRNRALQETTKPPSQPQDSKSAQPSLPLLDKKETKGASNTSVSLATTNSSLEGLQGLPAASIDSAPKLNSSTTHLAAPKKSPAPRREPKVEIDVENPPPSSQPKSSLPAPHSRFFIAHSPVDEKAQILLDEAREALDHAYPPRMVEQSDTRRAYLTQLAEYQSRSGSLNKAERDTLRQLLATLEEVVAQSTTTMQNQ